MNFFSRLMVRAAQELSRNPELQAKANEVVEDEIKPFAKQTWEDAQPKIQEKKRDFFRWTQHVRDEYRKGRDGD